MNKHPNGFSLRTVVEKVFAGVAATMIIAFVSAGTVAMCFPSIA